MTDPLQDAVRSLEESGFMDEFEEQPTHYQCWCQNMDCQWYYTSLLEAEAELAAHIHRQIKDDCDRIDIMHMMGLPEDITTNE